MLLVDYVPFLILLWGLYTVSGGIYLRATLVATPALNASFLVAGLVLASLMGTTGASMLLVRPMLRANDWRKHKAHVFVFFIFLVSNLGGLLTPLGDPPLFLGFIHGVPFFWTLRLFPEYLFVSAIVLAVFVAIDTRAHPPGDRAAADATSRRTAARRSGSRARTTSCCCSAFSARCSCRASGTRRASPGSASTSSTGTSCATC